jgi:hypothetical protein
LNHSLFNRKIYILSVYGIAGQRTRRVDDDDSTEFDWINSKEKSQDTRALARTADQHQRKNIYVNTDNYIEKIYKSTIQTTQPAPTGEKYTVVPYDTIIQIKRNNTTAHHKTERNTIP